MKLLHTAHSAILIGAAILLAVFSVVIAGDCLPETPKRPAAVEQP